MFKASGEEVIAIGFAQFVAMFHGPDRARAFKGHIQRVCGQSRFKQRLLPLDDHMLSDDLNVQLILLPFEASSPEQIWHLLYAAQQNDIQAMEQLLQRPQDPDLEIGGQPPALHIACRRGHTEAARLLLEANADKDSACVNNGSTPLRAACVGGCVEVVTLLLEANADKNKAENDGSTPLSRASKAGHIEVVRLLLEARADKDKAENNGTTPGVTARPLGSPSLAYGEQR